MAVVGDQPANALLRQLSRDGRLYPGLAQPWKGEDYVNSEDKGSDGSSAHTPPEEVERWFAGVVKK